MPRICAPMFGFGASARDTIERPAPIAKAFAAAMLKRLAKNVPDVAASAEPTALAIPAIALTAMLLPQY